MRKIVLLYILIFWAQLSYSSNHFIFYYYPDENERPLYLPEFEGPYVHVAMKTDKSWLHSHPYYGVRTEVRIPKMGPRFTSLKLPTKHFVRRFRFQHLLGVPFDREYFWGIDSGIYCSELFGIIFDISPTPIRDRPRVLGLSPTEIYNYLIENLGAKVIN